MTDMKQHTRRRLLKAGMAWTAAPWSAACGGGDAGTDASETAAPAADTSVVATNTTPSTTTGTTAAAATPMPTAVAPTVTSAYRAGQPYLFQSIAVANYPSTLGGSAFNADTWGDARRAMRRFAVKVADAVAFSAS